FEHGLETPPDRRQSLALIMQTLSVCTTLKNVTAITPRKSRFLFPALPAARLVTRPVGTIQSRAFTAIELIGVLAIISLIAAAVFPQVIRRIDRAALQRET